MLKRLPVMLFTLVFPALACSGSRWHYQPHRLSDNIKHHYQMQHYTIQPESVADLPVALNRASPHKGSHKIVHAHASWNVRWYFWYKEEGDTCTVNKTEVTLESQLSMPQLASQGSFSTKIRSRFNTYYSALLAHENGHIMFGIHAANEIEKSLASTPAQANCEQTGIVANKNAQNIVKKYSKLEAQYDVATQHGKTQGAYIQH